MNIRTITTGIDLELPVREDRIKNIAEDIRNIKDTFIEKGYTVQTVRLSIPRWEYFKASKELIVDSAKRLQEYSQKHGIDYFSMGTTAEPDLIPTVFEVISNTVTGFCTVIVAEKEQLNFEAARKTANLIKRLSFQEKEGFTNLRFAALFNVGPGCPFFPAAYHHGSDAFAIGTENSDLVFEAFSLTSEPDKAEKELLTVMQREYEKIEKIAQNISDREKIRYGGIDVSIAPSIYKNESLAFAFERLGVGIFGEVGTLFIAKLITDVLRKLDIQKCGYSGLMLPLMEDYGLGERNDQGTFDIERLLLFSSVCGTGLDTIPLPGGITEKKLFALILDVGALALKLGKPLSARLMPIPGKKAGDRTAFEFEYFINTKIMDL